MTGKITCEQDGLMVHTPQMVVTIIGVDSKLLKLSTKKNKST